MASSRSIVDYLVDQLGPGVRAKAMFGEYGIYLSDILIGLVCDDRLFLKPTDAAGQILGEHERESPYPGAKPAIVVPEDLWDDRTRMTRLAVTTAVELVKSRGGDSSKSNRGARAGRRPQSKRSRDPS